MGNISTKLRRIYINIYEKYCEEKVPGSEESEFVYDAITRIIYYKFTETEYYTPRGAIVGTQVKEKDYSYMSPYISENGKYCRFIDNKFVEVD